VLRCFLRYFPPVLFTHVVGGQIESSCTFKILIGDLEVMALGDQLRVTEPTADNMLGEFLTFAQKLSSASIAWWLFPLL